VFGKNSPAFFSEELARISKHPFSLFKIYFFRCEIEAGGEKSAISWEKSAISYVVCAKSGTSFAQNQLGRLRKIS
jgi:hypothetical protein